MGHRILDRYFSPSEDTGAYAEAAADGCLLLINTKTLEVVDYKNIYPDIKGRGRWRPCIYLIENPSAAISRIRIKPLSGEEEDR